MTKFLKPAKGVCLENQVVILGTTAIESFLFWL